MGVVRKLDRRDDGPLVYTYVATPGVLPVNVLKFPGRKLTSGAPPAVEAHSHDFLGLSYFERGGSMRLDNREWMVEDGDCRRTLRRWPKGCTRFRAGPVFARPGYYPRGRRSFIVG